MISNKYSNFFSKKPLRLSAKFRRPKTNLLKRNPKFKKCLQTSEKPKSFLKIIKNPVTTESAMKKIQSGNTLVFMVSPRTNKKTIKTIMKKLYKAKIMKVNTLITTEGEKKAYIRLSADSDALDIANKIGFI
mmetsp:Transcript_11082/g.26666  ORF Transcript_11082/g.26666 Transcript_11082/m.26666 type:complete len:132 (+) Transcript_11082:35-430(+)